MKRVALLWVVIVLSSGLALAQEQTGALQGRVVDASGAPIPAAAVIVKGPTILGGLRSTATPETGRYVVPNLPIGTYEVDVQKAGFTTVIYSGIHIEADQTFTIDATLKVSTVQQSVEVSGAAPMVDTASPQVSFTFTKEQMQNIPNARDPWAMMTEMPGITTDSINVGGTQTGNQPTFRGHGVDPTQNTYMLNGANVTDNTDNGASQFYFDVDSFSEMQVEVNAHGADVQTEGIVLNMVPKSGTNQFHGSADGFFSDDSTGWDNLDSALRLKGVKSGSNLHQYYDYGADVGGRILRDRLWFWGAWRYQDVQRFVTGTRNPDGTFPIDHTYLWYPSGQINWRISSKHNFSFYFDMAQKERFKRGLSALVPVVATWNQQGDPIARLFTFRDDWTVSPRFLLSFKANVMNQGFSLLAQSGVNTATTPSCFDLGTGAYSCAPPYEYGIAKNLRYGGVTGNDFVTKFLGGSHDLKFGLEFSRYQVFGALADNAFQTFPANLQLQFLNGKPSQVVLYAPGVQGVNEPTRDAYVQDGWTIGRVRLDLGLRWDWQANSLNSVTGPPSPFFPATTQGGTGNLITWNTFAPRIGVVYDIKGNARTLLRASYDRYDWQLWTNLGAEASTAGIRSGTYVWDDLNGDGRFEPGELGRLLAVSNPAANPVTIDRNLRPTVTDEVTAGLSRQLSQNLVLNGTFIFRKDRNYPWLINPGIGPSDYTAVQGIDPVTGRPLTFYNLSASKVSLSPDFVTTRRGYEQEYNGFEVELIRRFARDLQFVGSYTRGVQWENYGPGSYQDPQDINFLDGTRIPSSRPDVSKLEGSYSFPHHFMLSGSYGYQSGFNYTRTVNSTTAVGRILNQGNVVALTGMRDQQSYPGLNLLDARVSYEIPFTNERNLELMLDMFNVLNINTIDSTQTLTGPAYSRVLDFISPRIARFGCKFTF